MIGLVLTLLVLLRCIWCLSSVVSEPRADRNDRIVGLMMLGLVIALTLNNMMESLIFSPASAFGYFFVLLALQAERWRYDTLQLISAERP